MKYKLSTPVNQQLPALDNRHITDWLQILTERAFMNWLKLMVIAQSNRLYSAYQLAASLKLSVEDMEQHVIKPLYEVELIEIQKGPRTTELIINPYPQNKLDKGNTLKKSQTYHMFITQPIKESKLTLEEVLVKHNDKLWRDGVDKNMLRTLYKDQIKFENALSEANFAKMLDTALANSKTKIGSKGSQIAYFRKVIENFKNKLQ